MNFFIGYRTKSFITFALFILKALTLKLPIINTKLFLQNQLKWLVFKKYLIIKYFYIYWFITFLQKELINESWYIYKIVELVILTGVIFLVLAFSDLAIDPEFSWWLISSYRMMVKILKTCGKLYKTRNLVNWGSINRLHDPFTLWQVPAILTGVGISSLDTKLFWIWIHKKQNKIHYIILLVIVAKVITSLWEKI